MNSDILKYAIILFVVLLFAWKIYEMLSPSIKKIREKIKDRRIPK